MSHALFNKGPALRQAVRRSVPRPTCNFYHSSSGPRMPSSSASIQTLLRQTTLRATAIAAQRSSFPVSRPLSQTSYSHQSSQSRSRSPSPPPPYQTRSVTVLASPNQWTRFNSSNNTLSSVRTFVSKPRIQWPADTLSSLSAQSQSVVEGIIEQIQELYGTAKDEFEIASEETEKNTTYAEDDRAAAREELDRLLDYYRGVVEGENKDIADEVKRRVGGRIRELAAAVKAMEEAALQHD